MEENPYGGQIFDASHHTERHLASLIRRLRAGIQRGPESLTNLLHAILQLVPLEEDDEDGFEDFVALWIQQKKNDEK